MKAACWQRHWRDPQAQFICLRPGTACSPWGNQPECSAASFCFNSVVTVVPALIRAPGPLSIAGRTQWNRRRRRKIISGRLFAAEPGKRPGAHCFSFRHISRALSDHDVRAPARRREGPVNSVGEEGKSRFSYEESIFTSPHYKDQKAGPHTKC